MRTFTAVYTPADIVKINIRKKLYGAPVCATAIFCRWQFFVAIELNHANHKFFGIKRCWNVIITGSLKRLRKKNVEWKFQSITSFVRAEYSYWTIADDKYFFLGRFILSFFSYFPWRSYPFFIFFFSPRQFTYFRHNCHRRALFGNELYAQVRNVLERSKWRSLSSVYINGIDDMSRIFITVYHIHQFCTCERWRRKYFSWNFESTAFCAFSKNICFPNEKPFFIIFLNTFGDVLIQHFFSLYKLNEWKTRVHNKCLIIIWKQKFS